MATLAWLSNTQAVLFTHESFSGTAGQQLSELPQFTISGSGSEPILGPTTLNYPDVTAGSGLSASFSGSTKTASITYNSLSSPDPNIYNNPKSGSWRFRIGVEVACGMVDGIKNLV